MTGEFHRSAPDEIDWIAWVYRYAVLLWFTVFESAAYELDLKYAWNGFSPMDWVRQYTHVLSVSGAFPNGVLAYQYLAPMYLYPWAEA